MPCPTNEWFNTTHWSVVLLAKQSATSDGAMALDRLCRTYWYPLYAYVRRRGYGPEEAKDHVQDFFAHLLTKEFLAGVAPRKGKFRSFMLASLNHYLSNARERAQTARRGGGQEFIRLDAGDVEQRFLVAASAESSPEKLFDREWALALLDEALQSLRQEFVEAGKESQFEQLKGFLSCEGAEASYAELAKDWQTTANAVAAAVYRLRQRYRESVREQIAQVVAGPEEMEAELCHLFEALS